MMTWIFGLLLPKRDKEMLLGDLVEERRLVESAMGAREAERWRRAQIFKSVPPILWANIRRGGWLKTLGAAFAGYIVVAFLVIESDILLSPLLSAGRNVFCLVSLAAGFVVMMLGGYLVALIRRGAPTALGAIAGLLGILSLNTTGDRAPLWYQIALIIVGPVAALAGGRVCGRNKRGEA